MKENFKENFEAFFSEFLPIVSSQSGDWTVKGFIDIYKNIYTISLDTKVVSKIVELMLFPKIAEFAQKYNYRLLLCDYQNHYPDITFITQDDEYIALDIKSTYRIGNEKVNGMTLGAFTGYFRNRESTKNIKFPYKKYLKHYIFGIIYSRSDISCAMKVMEEYGYSVNNNRRTALINYISNSSDEFFQEIVIKFQLKSNQSEEIRNRLNLCIIDEQKKYQLDNLTEITSVVRDFDFFIQEKWKISSDKPGSGNTKNIGSTHSILELKEGRGLFTRYERGFEYFNDYWINYLTKDMAKAIDLDRPYYNNISSYFRYRGINEE